MTEEERAQEAKQKEKEKKEKAAKRKKEKAGKLHVAAIESKLPKGRAGQGRVRAPSMASLHVRAYEDRI